MNYEKFNKLMKSDQPTVDDVVSTIELGNGVVLVVGPNGIYEVHAFDEFFPQDDFIKLDQGLGSSVFLHSRVKYFGDFGKVKLYVSLPE
jgi:hypothetical protein